MPILELLKKYSFHIFTVFLFVLVSIYKFFPDKFGFTKIISNNPPVSSETNVSKDAFIYVDLSGAVGKPGVYKLPPLSRVGDLIAEGGGFTKNASALWVSRNLNLSKLLSDSQKVYVPYEWETYGDCTCAINSLYLDVPLIENYSSNNDSVTKVSGTGTKASTSPSGGGSLSTSDNSVEGTLSSKVNVNTATQDSLDALSGIGPAYALKIILNRPYKDLSELVSKSGVPESTLNKLSSNFIY